MQILVPSISRAKQRSSCAFLFASHYLSPSRRLCLLRTQDRTARAARGVIPPPPPPPPPPIHAPTLALM